MLTVQYEDRHGQAAAGAGCPPVLDESGVVLEAAAHRVGAGVGAEQVGSVGGGDAAARHQGPEAGQVLLLLAGGEHRGQVALGVEAEVP